MVKKSRRQHRKALEIYEQLKLERDAAYDYHQLGRVAQERNQLDQAEQWYREALEIFERLGYPPLKVDTLAQFGLFWKQREDFRAALIAFVAALGIAVQYRMPVG
ncbi:MAG TPA: tetratricopeptide repeat protein, partial [Candidatus Dormibacteraeota bacterium]